MWSRRMLFAAAGLALARAARPDQLEPALAPPAPTVRQVDIEISAYPLVFAQVRVNGRQVRALIDTGSSSPVRLSTRLAQQLTLVLTPDPGSTVQGLDGRRLAVQRGTVEALTIGDSVHRNMAIEVAADRVESIAAQVGTTFDVILGWGFLSRHNFMLDYRKRVLHFSDSPLQPRGNGVAFDYSVVNRLPVIVARWSDQEVKLLLDTGAPMCNIDAEFAQTPAGQIVSMEVLLGTVRLPLQWRSKDLSVTRRALGVVGTLGNNLLGQYAVYVNTRNRMVTLD